MRRWGRPWPGMPGPYRAAMHISCIKAPPAAFHKTARPMDRHPPFMGHFLSFSRSFAAPFNASGFAASGLNSVRPCHRRAAEFTVQASAARGPRSFSCLSMRAVSVKRSICSKLSSPVFSALTPTSGTGAAATSGASARLPHGRGGPWSSSGWQRRLVARVAEGVVHQLYRDDTGRLAVFPVPVWA